MKRKISKPFSKLKNKITVTKGKKKTDTKMSEDLPDNNFQLDENSLSNFPKNENSMLNTSLLARLILEAGAETIASSLVAERDLNALKFLVTQYNAMPDQSDVMIAAENGDIKMFKYLVDDLKLTPHEDDLTAAIDNQHLRMVKFLVTRYQIHPDQDAVRIAAENGDIKMLKYLIDDLKLMPDEDALIGALENQDRDMLIWLTTNKSMQLAISGAKATLHQMPSPGFLKLCFIKNPYIKIDYSEIDAKSVNIAYLYKLQVIAQVVESYQIFPKEVQELIFDYLIARKVDFLPEKLKPIQVYSFAHETYDEDFTYLIGEDDQA